MTIQDKIPITKLLFPVKYFVAKSPLVIAGNGKDIAFYMRLYENEPTQNKTNFLGIFSYQ
jgi:hypothetical protein